MEGINKIQFALATAAALGMSACVKKTIDMQAQFGDLANGVMAQTEGTFNPPITVDSKSKAETCIQNPSAVKIVPASMRPSLSIGELEDIKPDLNADVFFRCEDGLNYQTTWGRCSDITNPEWVGDGKGRHINAITCGQLLVANKDGEPITVKNTRIEKKAD